MRDLVNDVYFYPKEIFIYVDLFKSCLRKLPSISSSSLSNGACHKARRAVVEYVLEQSQDVTVRRILGTRAPTASEQDDGASVDDHQHPQRRLRGGIRKAKSISHLYSHAEGAIY